MNTFSVSSYEEFLLSDCFRRYLAHSVDTGACLTVPQIAQLMGWKDSLKVLRGWLHQTSRREPQECERESFIYLNKFTTLALHLPDLRIVKSKQSFPDFDERDFFTSFDEHFATERIFSINRQLYQEIPVSGIVRKTAYYNVNSVNGPSAPPCGPSFSGYVLPNEERTLNQLEVRDILANPQFLKSCNAATFLNPLFIDMCISGLLSTRVRGSFCFDSRGGICTPQLNIANNSYLFSGALSEGELWNAVHLWRTQTLERDGKPVTPIPLAVLRVY